MGLIRNRVREGEIKARATVSTPNDQRESELERAGLGPLGGFFWHLALFFGTF